MPERTAKKTLTRIARRVAGLEDERKASLSYREEQAVAHFAKHPCNFLFGEDWEGRPMWNTRDERDEANPVKPLPDYDYLRWLVELLHEFPQVFGDKARQVMFTTAAGGYMYWSCSFTAARLWIVSKNKEREAQIILRDKIRSPHECAPDWWRAYNPVPSKPAQWIPFQRTRSYIYAVPQTFASGDARGVTATGVFVDEAAFQDALPEILRAVGPMTEKLIACSTPEVAGPGAETYKTYLEDMPELVTR